MIQRTRLRGRQQSTHGARREHRQGPRSPDANDLWCVYERLWRVSSGSINKRRVDNASEEFANNGTKVSYRPWLCRWSHGFACASVVRTAHTNHWSHRCRQSKFQGVCEKFPSLTRSHKRVLSQRNWAESSRYRFANWTRSSTCPAREVLYQLSLRSEPSKTSSTIMTSGSLMASKCLQGMLSTHRTHHFYSATGSN